jgi:hypothetical protein
MRPWLVILIGLAGLAAFDHVANDSEGLEAVAVWAERTGRDIARAIHRFVMSVFGE